VLDHWGNLDKLTDYEKRFLADFIFEVQKGTAGRWLKENKQK
jgi:hypothetical protein